MNKYVVIISIGPVQSMIVSARKSRDLWSGSWLLSELAKACAKFFYDLNSKRAADELELSDIQIDDDNKRAELIFPFVENNQDLEPNTNFSVGNKLQVVLQADTKDELEKILNKAKDAVKQRYREEVNNALNQLNKADIRLDIWQSQIDDLVEVQWAWAEIKDNDDESYNKASQKAGEVLASRKNTREFTPLAVNPFASDLMIPKSSLDGLRETVLNEDDSDKKDAKKVTSTTRRKLALAKSEQLDVLGVIKRLGFEEASEQFTPISRVMADAWILEIAKKEPELLAKIIEIYHKLHDLQVVSKVTGNKYKNEKEGIYKAFPYDAEFLYLSRLEAKILEYEKSIDNPSNSSEEKKEIDEILQYLKDLKDLLYSEELKEYGEPYRYGALLLADGDRMGELLDKAKTQEQHREITKALSKFAGSVADIMRKYRGHCIYAGGDDVLGLVPLHTAQECAKALQKTFYSCLSKAVNTIKKQLNKDDAKKLNNPTLSVGLAICHLMTPFGIVRELADVAEKYAKGNDRIEKSKRRNALGILLSVRGGSDIQLRFNWSDEVGLKCFDTFIQYYQNEDKNGEEKKRDIPSRVAYDIREIYLRTKDFATDKTQAHVQAYEQTDENGEVKDLQRDIQLAELVRMLKKARTDKGETIDEKVIKKLEERGKQIGLEQLTNELIVARWLAAKLQNDLGKE